MDRKILKYRKSLFVLMTLIISMLNITTAYSGQKADDQEIMVIGTSRVTGGNVATARDNAISDALLKGVEDYLTLSLGTQGMISNFQRLINEVIPGSRDEIENFLILAEDNNGKYYRVLVRIKVNEKLMEEKLREMGIIVMEELPLKILLLVSQQTDEEGEVLYWWNDPESNNPLTSTELMLYRFLQGRGFNPVNRLLSIPEGEFSPDMRRLDLSDEDAIEWGRIFSSDIVILGKSEIHEKEMVSLNLKAIDVNNTSVISQDVRVEPIEHEESEYGDINVEEEYMDTLEKAVNSLITQMSPAMISSFKKTEEEINLFEIELRGLKNFEQLGDFNEFVENEINGVKSVMPRRIKQNSITLLIEFSGSGDSFINKIREKPNFPFPAEISRSEKGGFLFQVK